MPIKFKIKRKKRKTKHGFLRRMTTLSGRKIIRRKRRKKRSKLSV